LTISVGRFWSVQSILEFNAIKTNLRIMSDIERVFWTVLFRMASRVFLFFTPSDSSLVTNWFVCNELRTPVVKLVWEAFQPLFSRWMRWLMKPSRELYLSFFSCSFLSAPPQTAVPPSPPPQPPPPLISREIEKFFFIKQPPIARPNQSSMFLEK